MFLNATTGEKLDFVSGYLNGYNGAEFNGDTPTPGGNMDTAYINAGYTVGKRDAEKGTRPKYTTGHLFGYVHDRLKESFMDGMDEGRDAANMPHPDAEDFPHDAELMRKCGVMAGFYKTISERNK